MDDIYFCSKKTVNFCRNENFLTSFLTPRMKNVLRVAAHVPGMTFPKRAAWTPKIPDWPVIPESIKNIAAAVKPVQTAAAATSGGFSWPTGAPDKIEDVQLAIQLKRRRVISDAEADAIGGY